MRAHGRGKLAEIQRENAECDILLKTFCLNPVTAVYARISKCGATTRGEFYETWRVMVPWNCTGPTVPTGPTTANTHVNIVNVPTTAHTTTPAEPLEEKKRHDMRRDIVYRAMLEKVSSDPTKSRVLQLLYVFAATGWFPVLEKFYECMGDGRISHSSRVELMTAYTQWKIVYADRIQTLLSEDKNHFVSRGIDLSTVDFSRFDKYQRDYDATQRRKK